MSGRFDIGMARGTMSSGRAWEIVTFTQGPATLANITFSQKGIAHFQTEDLRRLLSEEGLVEFEEGDDLSGIGRPWTDDCGKPMWVVFILVEDGRGVHSRLTPALLSMSEHEVDTFAAQSQG